MGGVALPRIDIPSSMDIRIIGILIPLPRNGDSRLTGRTAEIQNVHDVRFPMAYNYCVINFVKFYKNVGVDFLWLMRTNGRTDRRTPTNSTIPFGFTDIGY